MGEECLIYIGRTITVDYHPFLLGIAQERKQQKAELMKQRDEYNKRASVLRKELDLLRRQKQELAQEHSSDRNTEMILRENGKLQVSGFRRRADNRTYVLRSEFGEIGERLGCVGHIT